MKEFLFTSESVSEGHPDKIADNISDAILDLYLKADPYSRVAVETLTTTNRVVLAGEVRGPASVTPTLIEEAVRKVVKDIGYAQEGFHWQSLEVQNYLHEQSADIAQGVDETSNKEEGAGDQGIMFGYACNETESLMPAPIYYSHKILKKLSDMRHNGTAKGLLPDSKAQVSLMYVNDKPSHATSVLISHQHEEALNTDDVRAIIEPVVRDILPNGWMPEAKEDLLVNPTGRFVIGGPDGDTGLTGRKIIVDTYGGMAPHGGGAFSGKDPTKVDRSAAYAARYLAKNIVAAGLAEKCTLQLAYAIGVAYPLSIFIDTHNTGQVEETKLIKLLRELMDLSPKGIRTHLGLNKPIYLPTASYGHFGQEPTADGHFSWEKLDLVDDLKSAFGA
ncbi:MAG: methionine adenosyltransferase [Alphaproteobacteria bacterium]